MTSHSKTARKSACFLLLSSLSFSLLLMRAVPARAQDTQQTDIQQLKNKLQQLEKSMEGLQQLQQSIEELKAQINALETKTALNNEVASLKAVAAPPANVKAPTQIPGIKTDAIVTEFDYKSCREARAPRARRRQTDDGARDQAGSSRNL